MCSSITDDHCGEKRFFWKKNLYNFFEPERDCFSFSGKMCQKEWRNCIPRVQKIILLENVLIEISSFYIFFRSLSEVILVLRRKSASRVGETAFRASRTFFQEKQILCEKIQLQTIFRLHTKNVRKNEKNYLTGVSNLQPTCTDNRSNEKKTFLQESLYIFSSFE